MKDVSVESSSFARVGWDRMRGSRMGSDGCCSLLTAGPDHKLQNTPTFLKVLMTSGCGIPQAAMKMRRASALRRTAALASAFKAWQVPSAQRTEELLLLRVSVARLRHSKLRHGMARWRDAIFCSKLQDKLVAMAERAEQACMR